MICYRDKTFCSFYVECDKGDICHRALTLSVKKSANEWWGKDEAPICLYVNIPNCFVELKIKGEKNENY